MKIDKNQLVLQTDNILLPIKDIEIQPGSVYGKSVAINTQHNKVDWSGCELAVSDLEGSQVIPHIEIGFLDLTILLPDDTSVLCKGDNSYSWVMTKYLRPGSPTLVMVLGTTLLTEPVVSVNRRQIPSVNCKQLISREGSPIFIGVKGEQHKNYSLCVIVKDGIN